MIVHNCKYDSYPVTVHNPTAKIPLWNKIIEIGRRYGVNRKPRNLTLVTWNNRRRRGLLQHILDRQRLPCIVLGKRVRHWRNCIKSQLLLKALRTVKTEFVMGMDCYDVVVVNDLGHVVERFLQHQCQLLFNAGFGPYPKCHREIEESLTPERPFRFLNGGVFIGYTKFLFTFLEKAIAHEDQWTRLFPHSEQARFRPIYHQMFPLVKVDSRCSLFQIIYNYSGNPIGQYVRLVNSLADANP